MKAIAPLWREARILYYRWARHDLRGKPSDPGVPEVVVALNDLYAQRPRPMLRQRCADMPGACMRDAACADYECPGHPWQQLHLGDGGHRVDGGQSVRVYARPEPPENRVLLALVGSLAVALGCAAAIALGCPVCLLF
jgi:hypothetical protein